MPEIKDQNIISSDDLNNRIKELIEEIHVGVSYNSIIEQLTSQTTEEELESILFPDMSDEDIEELFKGIDTDLYEELKALLQLKQEYFLDESDYITFIWRRIRRNPSI